MTEMIEQWLALPTADLIWLAVGFGGQAIFASRFLYQWIVSERAGRSHIPRAFWYLSLAGGLTLLSYAIHRADPVFILGQTTGAVIYIRNLVLLHRGGQLEST
ncbi:MAG: lipid-A-disaccharide synthase N-terminal domain-containing protein [Gammaproteobacteria bacterium]|nr:lipid-A-disaccharide synthase N-terminal domain-containing protein [Gammaproteobacteria bacterium]MDE0412784.1 lipid-A-disaccharide synthase N-terminal domain-containing protein [Gammaproteobacteria bacterium]